MKKSLTILGLIGLLIGAVIGGQNGKEAGVSFPSPSPGQQEVEALLIEGFITAANQYNQKLPMMLDEVTRLDEVTVGPGPRSVYHHTLPNHSSNDDYAHWIKSNLRAVVLQKVCASAEMKKSLQYGGIYVYAYYGSDGIEIVRFEIDRNDCGFAKLRP